MKRKKKERTKSQPKPSYLTKMNARETDARHLSWYLYWAKTIEKGKKLTKPDGVKN